ncbi:MAG: SGNH/GDSL hydrolase family protein [Planctomycetota bacterium]|nr:MAG: SGNH/GDSL hydrolase family protein [Planctomycetota bacterium]
MSASPTDPAPRRRLGFDAIAGRCLFVVLAAALLFEVTVRVIDWRAGRTSDFWLPRGSKLALVAPHPFLGSALQPGYDRAGDFQIHVNSLGMRGAEMSAAKPANTYRLLATGGSTTFCTGARSDAAAWPAQLGALLSQLAPAGKQYEVGNCGVSGWTTVENLIDLELRRVELEPDAWLFYGAANDARPVQSRGFKPDYTHVRRAWVEDEPRGLDRFLLGRSHAYAWLSRGLDPEVQQGALASKLFVENYKDLHMPSDRGVFQPGVQAYLRNVEHMLVVCKARGIAPLLCSFATCKSKLKPSDERVLETVAAMNTGLAALAGRHDVPFLDVAARVSDRDEWYDDWMHHNDEGCLALARAIAKAISERRLCGLGG